MYRLHVYTFMVCNNKRIVCIWNWVLCRLEVLCSYFVTNRKISRMTSMSTICHLHNSKAKHGHKQASVGYITSIYIIWHLNNRKGNHGNKETNIRHRLVTPMYTHWHLNNRKQTTAHTNILSRITPNYTV